jgi:hypothetical protein
VVGPQRDRKAVALIDERLHSTLERSHRALSFGEPSSNLNLEVGDLVSYVRDSSKDITRQKAYTEPVRVVKHDRVVHHQLEVRGGRHGRIDSTRDVRCLHPRLPHSIASGDRRTKANLVAPAHHAHSRGYRQVEKVVWHPSIVVQDGETSPDEALDPPLPLHVDVVGTVHMTSVTFVRTPRRAGDAGPSTRVLAVLKAKVRGCFYPT